MMWRLRQGGFSLIEISLVVVIMAIVAGSVLALLNAQQISARVSATQTKQEAIKQALINFVARNSRLPCPAVATAAQGAATYGVEANASGAPACNGTTVIGAGANVNVRGVVPWVTLGLSDDAALDGYNRRFTYQVRRSQADANAMTASTISTLTGNITVRNAAAGAIINTNNAAVAVIVSHGENGFGAYLPMTGTRMLPLPTTADEAENTDADTEYVQKSPSEAVANPFDDIVMWLAPDDILASLRNDGAVQTTTALIDEKFTAIRHALLAYATADTADPDGAGARTRGRRLPYADRMNGTCGGAQNDGTADNACRNGNVPWTTLGLAQTTITDPWGNRIRYTLVNPPVIATSGTSQTTPANNATAYTLSASGTDATLGTADDITMTTTVAELRGALLAASVTLDSP